MKANTSQNHKNLQISRLKIFVWVLILSALSACVKDATVTTEFTRDEQVKITMLTGEEFTEDETPACGEPEDTSMQVVTLGMRDGLFWCQYIMPDMSFVELKESAGDPESGTTIECLEFNDFLAMKWRFAVVEPDSEPPEAGEQMILRFFVPGEVFETNADSSQYDQSTDQTTVEWVYNSANYPYTQEDFDLRINVAPDQSCPSAPIRLHLAIDEAGDSVATLNFDLDSANENVNVAEVLDELSNFGWSVSSQSVGESGKVRVTGTMAVSSAGNFFSILSSVPGMYVDEATLTEEEQNQLALTLIPDFGVFSANWQVTDPKYQSPSFILSVEPPGIVNERQGAWDDSEVLRFSWQDGDETEPLLFARFNTFAGEPVPEVEVEDTETITGTGETVGEVTTGITQTQVVTPSVVADSGENAGNTDPNPPDPEQSVADSGENAGTTTETTPEEEPSAEEQENANRIAQELKELLAPGGIEKILENAGVALKKDEVIAAAIVAVTLITAGMSANMAMTIVGQMIQSGQISNEQVQQIIAEQNQKSATGMEKVQYHRDILDRAKQFDKDRDIAEKLLADTPDANFDGVDILNDIVYKQGGATTADLIAIKAIMKPEWEKRRDELGKESAEWQRIAKNIGWLETGARVMSIAGKVVASVIDPSRGLLAGMVYGTAENHDKGVSGAIANGVVGAVFNALGNVVGEIKPGSVMWNAISSAFFGGLESVAGDYVTDGKIDGDKAKMNILFGGIFGGLAPKVGDALEGASNLVRRMMPTKMGDALESAGNLVKRMVVGNADVDAPNIKVDIDAPKSSGVDLDAPTMRMDVPKSSAVDIDAPSVKVDVDVPKSGGVDVDTPSISPEVEQMASNIKVGDDGAKYADVDDVIGLQRQSTQMRTLKNADPDSDEKHLTIPYEKRFMTHTIEAVAEHLMDDNWVKGKAGGQDFEVRVNEIRTPTKEGTNAGISINTDRDYVAQYRVKNEDGSFGDWFEVPKERWSDKSYDLFAQNSGFTPDKAKELRPDLDWDHMPPAKQNEAWAGIHQQMPTDRFHVEASRDYAFQGVDPNTGRPISVESHLLRVKKGNARLADGDGLGRMYNEKVVEQLRNNNQPEAVAQIQKSVDALRDVRGGYVKQDIDVGRLPANLEAAMDVVKKAPVDYRATPEAMAEMNEQLAELGFPNGVGQVSEALSAQISFLGTLKK